MNIVRFEIFERKRRLLMKRLQKTFSRDLQNTLSLLGQSDLGNPITSYQQFTHHSNSAKKSPIQIITTVSQSQNSSKPKSKPKTKTKTKQNSPKNSLSKRRTPIKKHKMNSVDQLSLNSILENPISPSDLNIKKMFTLFHLERVYRQKKFEKMFYLWYKKLTRKLLKMRLDQQKSQSMIQSFSIVHINTPEISNQNTQTEFSSDIFNFSDDDDVQDFPNIVNNLSDTQLIHKIKTGSSIYRSEIDDDYNDNSIVTQHKENLGNVNYKKNEDRDTNLIENCFLSWKAERVSNDVVNQSCNLVSNIIEKSMSSEDSHESSENADKYINISISSDHSETNEVSCQLYKQNGDNNSIENLNNFNFTDSSGSNENLYEDEFNSTTHFNMNSFPQVNQSTISKNSTNHLKLNSSIQQQASSTNSIKKNDLISINDNNEYDNSWSRSNNHNLELNSKFDNQMSRKERNRPPPVDLEAKALPPTNFEYRPQEIIKTKPESELKRYLRNIITESFFESVKSAQKRNDVLLPKIIVPPNVQKPWQFTNEYCELIVDVVTEITQTTNLINYTTEDFVDFLSNFFEKSHNQRNKTIFSELESMYQKKYDDFLLNYSIDIADSLLQDQIDYIFGI